MDNYYEMEAEQKSNSRRLKQLNRRQKGPSRQREEEKSSSFSMRMIIVMLILSVTMFLKQTDILGGNAVYEAAMAEIGRQPSAAKIKEVWEENIALPVMNWLDGNNEDVNNAHN